MPPRWPFSRVSLGDRQKPHRKTFSSNESATARREVKLLKRPVSEIVQVSQ
jgi:hypothetical protein